MTASSTARPGTCTTPRSTTGPGRGGGGCWTRTTWSGPSRRRVRGTPQHGLSSKMIALITSVDCIMGCLSIKWPWSPRVVCPAVVKVATRMAKIYDLDLRERPKGGRQRGCHCAATAPLPSVGIVNRHGEGVPVKWRGSVIKMTVSPTATERLHGGQSRGRNQEGCGGGGGGGGGDGRRQRRVCRRRGAGQGVGGAHCRGASCGGRPRLHRGVVRRDGAADPIEVSHGLQLQPPWMIPTAAVS